MDRPAGQRHRRREPRRRNLGLPLEDLAVPLQERTAGARPEPAISRNRQRKDCAARGIAAHRMRAETATIPHSSPAPPRTPPDQPRRIFRQTGHIERWQSRFFAKVPEVRPIKPGNPMGRTNPQPSIARRQQGRHRIRWQSVRRLPSPHHIATARPPHPRIPHRHSRSNAPDGIRIHRIVPQHNVHRGAVAGISHLHPWLPLPRHFHPVARGQPIREFALAVTAPDHPLHPHFTRKRQLDPATARRIRNPAVRIPIPAIVNVREAVNAVIRQTAGRARHRTGRREGQIPPRFLWSVDFQFIQAWFPEDCGGDREAQFRSRHRRKFLDVHAGMHRVAQDTFPTAGRAQPQHP